MKTQDSLMLYKLMILYMLKVSTVPITNSDISDYILTKGYTDSYKLQSSISELISTEMIIAMPRHNRTYLELLPEGINTIDSLESRISPEIRREIYTYLLDNAHELRQNHSIIVNTTETDNGDYAAICNAYDKKGELFSVKITFPTKQLAERACDNFEKNSEDIYEFLIKKLM